MNAEMGEARISNIESRLNNIEVRLNSMDTRFNNLDSRLNSVENRLTVVPVQDTAQLSRQLESIERGGRRNFFFSGLAFSAAAMTYAGNLLAADPKNILGLLLVSLGLSLFVWSVFKFPWRTIKKRD